MEISGRQDFLQGSQFLFRYKLKVMKLGNITQGISVDSKENRLKD